MIFTKNNSIKSTADFKKIFLLGFTKELIKHSRTGEIIHLENVVNEEEKAEKEEIKREKQIIKQIVKKEIISPFENKKIFPPQIPKPIIRKRIPIQAVLKIPETKFPAHLSYLKPSPNPKIEIDLEKLNSLIKDPAVMTIEAIPEEKIIVTGKMGRKPTNITLTKEEINKIIQKFSEITKIPIHEGIFKVVAGKLILSAIISEIVGSKFIIKKMMYAPVFR